MGLAGCIGNFTGEIIGGFTATVMGALMVMFIGTLDGWVETKFPARLVEGVVDALFGGFLGGFMVACTNCAASNAAFVKAATLNEVPARR